ncbi:unnamed protein product [Symbiodinium pilosum]|uniref:ASCH domain-containing protein n=1 Tax=Symbiodinium pilosum TaxID=2952 RepID=A0A812VE20_SYMPI|nr:unnamed protein product [Symbiodinium pilosum]
MAPKVQPPAAAVAFGNTAYALKIKPYWLAQILRGEKRLEIRGCRCAHPEKITLMETGTLLLRARANVTESHLMTDTEMVENHEAVSALDYKEYWAWTLTEVEILDPPIPVPSLVARGSVTWMLRARWEAWDKGLLRTPATIPDFFTASTASTAGPSASSRSRSRSPPSGQDSEAEP